MTILQAVYTDPTIKPEIRVAAAKAVLPHQRPKLSIQGYANVTSLARRLDEARPKVIENDPKPALSRASRFFNSPCDQLVV